MKFPGALSLTEELDRDVLVILRDGRHLVGCLTSFDQFSNIVLEDAKEWFLYKDMFSEEPLGCFVIRSDNIVMVCQMDTEKAKHVKLRRVPVEEMNEARMKAEEAGEDVADEHTKWCFDLF